MWVGKAKCRTCNGLRQRVVELSSLDTTRSQGVLLNEYAKKVAVAERWRGGGIIAGLSDKEVAQDLKALEGAKMTADICQALVSRVAERFAAEKQWFDLVVVLSPFRAEDQECTFNPSKPQLRALPRLCSWRLSCFLNCFVNEQLNMFALVGEKGHKEVKAILQALEKALESEDTWCLDALSASTLSSVGRLLLQVLCCAICLSRWKTRNMWRHWTSQKHPKQVTVQGLCCWFHRQSARKPIGEIA